MDDRFRRRAPLVFDGVVVAAAAIFRAVHRLGEGGLRNWDDGLYCAATREMAYNGGSLLYATIDGRFDGYYGKPPLLNWLELASTSALGFTNLALRLPTALATALAVWLAWALGVRLSGRLAGALAACALLATAPFFDEGRFILLEPLLAASALGALLLHDVAATRGGRLGLAVAALAGVCAAAGLLAKQVLGLFPVLAVLGVELALRRPGWRGRALVFAGSAAAIAGGWLALAYAEVGEPLLRSFFERHVQDRLDGVVEGHENAPKAYASRLLGYARFTVTGAGLVGLVALPRLSRARSLAVALLLLFAAHYVVHALLAKTLLAWYPWPMVPVLAVAAGALVGETFALDRSRALRWVIPALFVAELAYRSELDPIRVFAAGVLVAAALELGLAPRLRAVGPALLVALALGAGVATMAPPRGPNLAGLAERVQQDAATVFLTHPKNFVPRCVLPRARFLYTGTRGACEAVRRAMAEVDTREVVMIGGTERCDPGPGYRMERRGERWVLHERAGAP